MLKDKTLTYISLFSCAGVGCFGFKKAGFECIATNELIERRLNVQKFNNKCRFDSGYICADITTDETKHKIFDEIKRWESLGNDRVDVLIATPPCQGMSVANHKKADNEIVRNSLVVESIKLVLSIKPRFFIFENVPAFMKTGCTAPDGTIKTIGDVIVEELSGDFCRGCGYCLPCPAEIPINQCARMSLLLRRGNAKNFLSPTWQENMKKIENCINCGACASRCPYGLNPPEMLKKHYEDYKNVLAGKASIDKR